MNLLQIALTTKCNRRCKECPMLEFVTSEHPQYGLNNVRLIPFIYKNVDPKKWFIELTGGEPALYEGLDELCMWLTNHEYRGLIKTNGDLPIKKYGHFPRIAAWHGKELPKYYDQILLIYGIQGYWEKAKFCRDNGIPYETVGLDKDSSIDNVVHNIERVSFINAIGQVLHCPADTPNPTQGQYGDLTMVDFSELRDHEACKNCKAIQDFWRFIEPAWKEM